MIVRLLKDVLWAATADVSDETFSAVVAVQWVEEIVGRGGHNGAMHSGVGNRKSVDSSYRGLENSGRCRIFSSFVKLIDSPELVERCVSRSADRFAFG